MAEIVLRNTNFVNNKLYVGYGVRKQAMFTIVDESFSGMNTLGRVNRVTCILRQLDVSGKVTGTPALVSLLIGVGDGSVGVSSTDPALRGKPLTHENMEQCVVTLYED